MLKQLAVLHTQYVDRVDLERLSGFGLSESKLWAVTHVEMRRSARVPAAMGFLVDVVARAPMRLPGDGESAQLCERIPRPADILL